MRICILIDAWEPVWGGGQTHVWETAVKLVKRGWKIDIFTRSLLNRSRGKTDFTHSNFSVKNLNVYKIGKVSEFHNLWSRVSWLFLVVAAVRKQNCYTPYDLIHAHAYTAGLPAKILSKLLQIPVVFTVHGSNYLDRGKIGLGYFLEKFLLTQIRYTKEISVSQSFLRHPNRNRNIKVISNGVNLSLFDGTKATNKKKKFFDYLWVGRFDQVKGIEILLKAFSKVRKQNSFVRLTLVGGGQNENTIKALVSQLSIGGSVHFISKKSLPELPLIYKQADVFILPSLSEGQPVTLLEAWAARLPVIVTDVGDNVRFVRSGENGFLVRAGSVEELALIMSHLCRFSTSKLKNIGKKGYELVKKQFQWDDKVTEIEKIYLKLLRNKKI